MPGGGLFRRVESATAAFSDGPDSIIQRRKAAESQEDAGLTKVDMDDPINQELCDVRAFSVWYWSDEGSFVPETMYLNAKDAGHSSSEPRLVVSLSSFEALSQAYVQAVEKEGVKAASLSEKEDLLNALRVGYYKELVHLREMLDAAKEQMALASKRSLDDADLQRMQAFERMVKTTDVHYFSIIDYLEPELKAIMEDAVKSFNRDLMKEMFDLRDRLALHEGTDGDDSLAERILTMLLSRGYSPAKIVKLLSDMIVDQKQSDEFHAQLMRLLNLGDRALDEVDPKSSIRPNAGSKSTGSPEVSATENNEAAGDDDSKGRFGRSSTLMMNLEHMQDEQLLEEAQRARDEIERLKAEMKKLMKQVQAGNQALASLKEQHQKDLAAAVEKCKKDMYVQTRQKRASEISSESLGGGRGAGAAGAPAAAAAAAPGAAAAAAGGVSAGASARAGAEAGAGGPHSQGGGDRGVNAAHVASLQAELNDAHRKQAEADRRIADLERKLREAEALAAKLQARRTSIPNGALPQNVASSRPRVGNLLAVPGMGNDSGSASPRPAATPRTPRTPRQEDDEGEDMVPSALSFKRRKGISQNEVDRSGLDRSGNYSALTGKPMLLVEDELKHERELRIKYECKSRDLMVEIDDFKMDQKSKDREIAYLKRDLEETTEKLTQAIERDENDGVEDVQVFCNWLLKKYGSLDAGFRALDDDSSGTMSLSEFIGGLKQMGWLRIVGKRLYKVFDSKNTGQFTLSQLQEVYDKFVNGQEGTQGQMNDFDAGEREDMRLKDKKDKAAEAQAAAVKELKARAKILEEEKLDLQEEVTSLQRKIKREDAKIAATVDGRDLKSMERKVDSIKAGYENLKQERDEMVSKMTAAMWKCRVAHITQVKLGREAAEAKEELQKLQTKFEFFKTSMKRQKSLTQDMLSASLPNIGVPMRDQLLTMSAGVNPPASMGSTWTPGALERSSLISGRNDGTRSSLVSVREDQAVKADAMDGDSLSDGKGAPTTTQATAPLVVHVSEATTATESHDQQSAARTIQAVASPSTNASVLPVTSVSEAASTDAYLQGGKPSHATEMVVGVSPQRGQTSGASAIVTGASPLGGQTSGAPSIVTGASPLGGQTSGVPAIVTGASPKGAAGATTVRCPKCNAMLQFLVDSPNGQTQSPQSVCTLQHSQSPTSIRAVLQDAVPRNERESRQKSSEIANVSSTPAAPRTGSTPAAGDEAGGGCPARPEASSGNEPAGHDRQNVRRITFGMSEGSWAANLSPEDMIANMTDEELLFGAAGFTPGAHGGPSDGKRASLLASFGGDEIEKSLQKGTGSAYRAKLQALGGGRHQRWQALFADATERHRSCSPQLKGEAANQSQAPVPSSIKISKQSQNLIQHARQVSQTLWREAVPLEEVMPEQQLLRSPEAAGGPESGAGLGSVSISGTALSSEVLLKGGSNVKRNSGVGGAPKGVRGPAKDGRVHLGRANFTPSAQLDMQSLTQGHKALERKEQDGVDIGQVTSSPTISSFSAARSSSQGSQLTSGQHIHGKVRQGLGLTRVASCSGLEQSPALRKAKGDSAFEQIPALRKAKTGLSREELSPPLLIVGNLDGGIEEPVSLAAVAAVTAPQQRGRTAPSPILDTSSALQDARVLGPNGISPFGDDEPDTLRSSGSRGHLSKPQGMWKPRAQSRGKQTVPEGDEHEDLGSGLPPQPPVKAASSQKSVSGALRQQGTTRPAANAGMQLPSVSKAMKRGVDAVLNGCMSMPDLKYALARPANVVRTPPLADEKAAARTAPAFTSDERVAASKRKQQSTAADAGPGDGSEAAPFEAPLLYVGKAPPGPLPKRDTSVALVGAGKSVPSAPPAALRLGLARAASVFELGSHVQAHAEAEGQEDEFPIPLRCSSYKDQQT